jgi:molecular chaperone GrpE (heat shock protein)
MVSVAESDSGSDASPAQDAVSASPKALSAGRVKAEFDKFSDRTGKATKEIGDQPASNLKSNLKKVGDNIAKAMKANPAKHRVGAKNGAGSGSGSSAGAGSEG